MLPVIPPRLRALLVVAALALGCEDPITTPLRPERLGADPARDAGPLPDDGPPNSASPDGEPLARDASTLSDARAPADGDVDGRPLDAGLRDGSSDAHPADAGGEGG